MKTTRNPGDGASGVGEIEAKDVWTEPVARLLARLATAGLRPVSLPIAIGEA